MDTKDKGSLSKLEYQSFFSHLLFEDTENTKFFLKSCSIVIVNDFQG